MKSNKAKTKYIERKIIEVYLFLNENNFFPLKITANELLDYFKGDTPSGDTITLEMVLDSKWLLIHEIVELSELKKEGFEINSDILFTNPKEVFEAHLIATEWEIHFANKENDHQWIKRRRKDIQNWLDDSSLNEELKTRCIKLLQMFHNM